MAMMMWHVDLNYCWYPGCQGEFLPSLSFIFKPTQIMSTYHLHVYPNQPSPALNRTGKSALIERGLEEPAQKMGIAFAGGKFDLNKTALPLSAFSTAMGNLTEFIMENKHQEKIKDDIKKTLNADDINNLLSVVPGCWELFDIEENRDGRRTSVGGKEAVQRLQYAVRRLLKVICSNLRGVVLFIDDLQWSDAATIEMLNSVIMDRNIPSLLVVGAYRKDEVSE